MCQVVKETNFYTVLPSQYTVWKKKTFNNNRVKNANKNVDPVVNDKGVKFPVVGIHST